MTAPGTNPQKAVLCSNEDHDEPTRAIYRVEFPGGRWNTDTCCSDCLPVFIDNMLDEPVTVKFTAVNVDA